MPAHKLHVVGDDAYVGRYLLRDRPANVQVTGPVRWDAALSEPLGPDASPRRKKGDRLPPPKALLDDDRWPWETICLDTPRGEKTLLVKVVTPVCW